MKLIVGLGNPGKKYEKTRHNVGFKIVDALHEALLHDGVTPWELSRKFNAEIAGCTVANQKVILVKPMTYMNESGQSVQMIAHFYKITPTDIIVTHDDIDLLLGDIKIQTDRGHAGHNGVRSIMEIMNTKNFTRVRVGVRSTEEKKMTDMAKFVLGKFGLFERKKLDEMVDRAVKEIVRLIKS